MKRGQRKRLQPVSPGGEVAIPRSRLPVFRTRLNLSYILKRIGGKRAAIDYARMSAREEMVQLVQIWDSLSKSRQDATKPEDLLAQVDMAEADFLSEIVKVVHQASADVSRILVAIHQPTMIEKTIQFGKKEANWRDREMFLKGSGFLPVPTSQFGIMVNNNQGGGPQQTPQQVPDANLPPLEHENIQHQPFERSNHARSNPTIIQNP